jgi:putative flippase GtrA
MKKKDIISSFIIGEAAAVILLLIYRFLQLSPQILSILKYFPVLLPLLSVFGIFIVSLFEKRFPVVFQAGKSFLVGILNTLIDLSILTVLMETSQVFKGLPFVVFKGISFSGATLNSYFWNKFWTFEKKETKDALRETSQFYLITIGGLLIHLGISSLVVNIIGPQFGIPEKIWAYVGAISAVFFGFVWNFAGYKFIVFRK